MRGARRDTLKPPSRPQRPATKSSWPLYLDVQEAPVAWPSHAAPGAVPTPGWVHASTARPKSLPSPPLPHPSDGAWRAARSGFIAMYIFAVQPRCLYPPGTRPGLCLVRQCRLAPKINKGCRSRKTSLRANHRSPLRRPQAGQLLIFCFKIPSTLATASVHPIHPPPVRYLSPWVPSSGNNPGSASPHHPSLTVLRYHAFVPHQRQRRFRVPASLFSPWPLGRISLRLTRSSPS